MDRVVWESVSVAHFSILTGANFSKWVLLVEDSPGGYPEDRQALSVLLRAVPPKLLCMLGVKKISKEAWYTLKIIKMGVERVWEVR